MKLLVKLMYDGTAYHGFQYQPNASSIQGVLTEKISDAFGFPCTVTGCSRTDSGVHALGYCAAVEPAAEIYGDTWCSIPPSKIHRLLNMYLPDDIAVIGACMVGGSFHPRYSAVSKEYVYLINDRPYPDPFQRFRAYHVKRSISDMQTEMMNAAAAELLGRHDFSGFMASGSSVKDTSRCLTHLDVRRREDGLLVLTAAADGFLYNMVRILTGTLLDVAWGKLSPSDMKGILESSDRTAAGFTAPAHGLYLNKVNYGEDIVFLAD